MTLAIVLAASLCVFYAGLTFGCWATKNGRESAYLEGANDGIGYEKRRALSQAQEDSKTFDSEELGAA